MSDAECPLCVRFYEAIPKLAISERNSIVALPIKRPILVCTMCHNRSWAMLLRIEEHLSFQKGIGLAGACTPYHVVTLKPPSNSHGRCIIGRVSSVRPAARGKANMEISLPFI